MKNKFRLWLNIVTICLCVCAIAIGVYSATTANLNASGKLGFTAHGCDVDITAYMYGHSDDGTADGQPVAEADPTHLYQTASPLEIRSETKTLDIGSRYFTDMASNDGTPEDIVVVITVTNASAFKITATFDATNITKPNKVTVTSHTASADIEVDATATFKITLHLEANADGSYTNITMPEEAATNNLSMAFGFEKYVEPDFKVNANGQLITTMGHATPTDIPTGYEDVAIEWFAFAVLGEGDTYTKPSFVTSSTFVEVGEQKWYSLAGVNMTGKTLTGKTFWFIQRYVTAGGYSSSTGSTITGQVFDADSNDYDKSDICAYLSETGAYITTSVTGIADTDLYGKITERSVSAQDNTFSSRLWLLSKDELALLGSQGSEPVKAYGIGNTVGNSGSGAYWWLRSPNPRDPLHAHYVSNDGILDSIDVYFDYGVRAAFEITIS